MKVNPLQKNIISYYISLILITLATTLPHSVLTILLLHKGLNLSQIFFTQVLFSLAVLFSEYPSGILGDLYSKKRLFLLSDVFIFLMMWLVLTGKSFFTMGLAWILYGIANAIQSGTIDSDIINQLKKSHEDSYLARFIANTNRFNFIAMLVGSTVGSLVYYIMGVQFYWIGIGLTLLSGLVTAITYHEMDNNSDRPTAKLSVAVGQQIREGFHELGQSVEMRLMLGLTFVSQFFFQAHYQMWQALFLSQHFDRHYYFLFYIAFQLISIGAYSINLDHIHHRKRLMIILGLVMMVSLVCLPITHRGIFIVSYLCFVFVFTVLDYFSNLLFTKRVSQQHISSLVSFKSSCGRIAAIISMLLSSLLVNNISVMWTVMLNFTTAIVFSGIILRQFFTNNKRHS